MDSIFRVFRSSIVDSISIGKTPTKPGDVVNKAYVDGLPYATGPGSSIADQVPVFDGATGNALKVTPVYIDFVGNITGAKDIAANTITTSGTGTFNGGVIVPFGQVVAIADAPVLGTSAANKDYVDSAVVATGAVFGPGVTVSDSTIMLWDGTTGQAAKEDPLVTVASGVITANTFNSNAAKFQIASTDYLSYYGGTAANPNNLLVGPTGLTAPNGVSNIFMGTDVGHPSQMAVGSTDNVVIGNNIMNSALSSVTATGNVFIGNGISSLITTADTNVVIGNGCGAALTSGDKNVVLGDAAGSSITSADYSICIGRSAGSGIESGDENICIGHNTGGALSIGEYNVLMGYNAGNAISTADDNVCIGRGAGLVIFDGNDNVCIGHESGDFITSGSSNVTIGSAAGEGFKTSSNSVAVGHDSAWWSDAGNNVAVGAESMQNTHGGNNVILGFRAGYGSAGEGSTTYQDSVLIGFQSGYDITTGNNNVVVGNMSGYNITTGNNNVFVGSDVGTGLTAGGVVNTTGNNNVVVGMQADTQNHSNVIVLGSGGQSEGNNYLTIAATITKWNSSGLGPNTAGVTAPLLFDTATGDIGYDSSSLRYKTNVRDLHITSEDVYSLVPRSFEWIESGDSDWGLVAEEVETTFPELVIHNSDGTPESVKYHRLVVPLLNEVKKLKERNDTLENVVEELLARLSAVEAKML